MEQQLKLYGITTTYNVEEYIPYVMKYNELMGYDKLYVIDNGSTDNTVELLKRYPFVEVSYYNTNGSFDDNAKLRAMFEIYNQIKWDKENEDNIVWLTMQDFDEVTYYDYYNGEDKGRGLKYYLYCLSMLGYNVCAEEIMDLFKKDETTILKKDILLHEQNVKCFYGEPFLWNKPTLFMLSNLNNMYYHLGQHFAHFDYENGIKIFNSQKFLFRFHLKNILGKEYTSNRNKLYLEERNYLCKPMYENTEYKYDYEFERAFDIKEYMKHKFLNGKDYSEVINYNDTILK